MAWFFQVIKIVTYKSSVKLTKENANFIAHSFIFKVRQNPWLVMTSISKVHIYTYQIIVTFQFSAFTSNLTQNYEFTPMSCRMTGPGFFIQIYIHQINWHGTITYSNNHSSWKEFICNKLFIFFFWPYLTLVWILGPYCVHPKTFPIVGVMSLLLAKT